MVSGKSIVFTIGTLASGGAERVVSILANSLCESYDIYIIRLYDKKLSYNLDTRVKIIDIDTPQTGFTKSLRILFKLRNIIKELKPMTVIAFLPNISIYTGIATLFLNHRLICSERNDPTKEPSSGYLRLLRGLIYRWRADALVVQAENVASYFSRNIQSKTIVIPNPALEGLPQWKFDKQSDIVTVARLTPQKNISVLLSAFARISSRYNCQLFVYGEGESRERLIQEVADLGLVGKVHFMGFHENVHHLLLDKRFFVLSSLYEGMPNALIEAMLMGMPVISTDSPIGIAGKLIQNQHSGILARNNDIDDLARAMELFLTSDELLLRCSLNAQKSVSSIINNAHVLELWNKIIHQSSEENNV